MIDVLTIASSPGTVAKAARLKSVPDLIKSYRIRKGESMTVFTGNNEHEPTPSIATWGITRARKELLLCPLSQMFSRKPYSIWMHNNRCVVPVNCFYCPKGTDLHLVRLIDHRLFWLGAILVDDAFAVLTVEAADVLGSICNQMPVILTSDQIRAWLHAEHIRDLVDIADGSGDHWFDFYKIDPELLTMKNPTTAALKQTSLSLRESEEKKEMLDNLDFNDDRFNRSNSKRR